MNLILIAGLPATGKSRFASYLQQRLNIPLLCKDSIKEILFDTIGFQSHDEKTKLNHAALESLYYAARQILAAGSSVILENNFEWYALPGLEQMIAAYGCEPITIFFGGDERVIYRRYVERNADPTRHRGHVLSTCYPEKDTSASPEPISLQEISESFRKRGCRSSGSAKSASTWTRRTFPRSITTRSFSACGHLWYKRSFPLFRRKRQKSATISALSNTYINL